MLPNPLVVFPHRRISGVDGFDGGVPFHRKGYRLIGAPVRPSEAWLWVYDTNAHAVGYAIPNEEFHFRINKKALSQLKSIGKEPLLHWLIVDVDNPGHEPWSGDPTIAFHTVYKELSWSLPEGAMDQLGLYLTKRGYRLVLPLLDPVPVSEAESLLEGFVLMLLSHGISGVDETCTDWTRMFLAPFVVRDGVPQRYPARFPWIATTT